MRPPRYLVLPISSTSIPGQQPGWARWAGVTATLLTSNDAGQVVGVASLAPADHHAFVTGPDGADMRDLGTLGGRYSVAYGISEAGEVVGWAQPPNGQQAFITGPDGAAISLGSLGGNWSEAYGVNDAGQAVGASRLTVGGPRYAFVTGADGVGMSNLNSLVDLPEGQVLTDAFAINNAGQVVAVASTIPEPESYALLLAGLVLTGFMARRRKAQNLAEYY